MISSSLPTNEPISDSANEVKAFFDRYYKKEVTFPASQIDAMIGYFLKRGFDKEAARSTTIVLLTQSKIDQVNPFKVLDTLKGLTDTQLSQLVAEVLNLYREKTSVLGYKLVAQDETLESRNILL